MKCCIAAAVFLSIALTNAWALSPDEKAARDSALQWLEVMDSGHYAQAYREMPPRVRTGKGEEIWVDNCRARRTPLGHANSRKFMKAVHTTSIIGAPDGNYYRIGFKTSFERKHNGAELLVLTRETGHWQVSGYRVY